MVAGHPACVFEMEVEPGAQGGSLFCSERLYVGLGSNGEGLVMHRYGAGSVRFRNFRYRALD